MAKGDKKKVQQQVTQQVGTAQTNLDALRNNAIIPNFRQNQDYYTQAADEAKNDYRNIMDQYKNFQAKNPNQLKLQNVDYNRNPEMNEAFGGYRNFMQTGGFSDEDVANMRARGISPIRAVYANMANELARQKNLQGGYSPNMAAAMTRMRGSTSQQIADQVQNVNAQLAEQIQRGKMFGTEGMGNLSVRDLDFAQQAKLANQQAALQASREGLADPSLSAIHGQAQLFGTTPGMARMFGEQTQQGIQNWLNAEQQQQGIGQMGIGGQNYVSQIPSDFQVGAGRVGKGLEYAGRGVAAVMTGGASEAAIQAYKAYQRGKQ